MKSHTETLIASELLESTFYWFKIRCDSQCKHCAGIDSDVSDPIQTKMFVPSEPGKPSKPSKPGKPKASKVTHDSIQLKWKKSEQGAHIITSYTLFYRSISDHTDVIVWSEKNAIMNEEVLLSQLSENTVYYFKVRPECEAGTGLESDISDPIRTKMIIPSMPSKPKASSVTHNSIQLEWTKPREGAHNVTSYVIFYQCLSDIPDKWNRFETNTDEETVTVSNLQQNTTYHFKLQPKYSGGVGKESDISESIKTKELLVFNEVFRKLWNASVKWYNIGLCLGLDKTSLDIIKKNNQQDIDSCFREMLNLWFKQVRGTWQMLIDALHDETVGFHDLANSITDETVSHESITVNDASKNKGFKCPLCGTCSLDKYLKRECPQFYSLSDSAFPFLDTNKLTEDEKLALHVKLIKETNNINDNFNDLLYQLSELFEEMPSQTLKSVTNFVKIRLSISNPVLDSEVISASSIVQCLKETASFFNYNNVQHIIAKFGREMDKEMLSTYERNFKTFCERSMFEVPEAVFGPPPDHGQMLVFKVTDQIIENLPPTQDCGIPVNHHTVIKSAKTLRLSLNDALKVQMKIAEVLGIENVGCLSFQGASKGCIELKFSAPFMVLEKVKEQHDVETLTELPGFAELEAANIHILCGPPGKPYTINVTSNSIHLQWSKPEYQGSHPIQHYCVHYKSLMDPTGKWRTVQSKALVETLEIGKLSLNETPFIFKVQAVNVIGTGAPSEVSDPIDLMQSPPIEISRVLPSKPSKPKALSITHNSLQLEWTKPDIGVGSITSYTILYRSQFNDPPNQWRERRTAGPEEKIIVSQLMENTTYLFLVRPECETGVGSESDISDPIKVT